MSRPAVPFAAANFDAVVSAHEVLGLPPPSAGAGGGPAVGLASTRDVTRAYRRVALTCHPDKSDHPLAAARFAAVGKAYELLLDADWALNSGNWMWLSASCFFYQYFRCYRLVLFQISIPFVGFLHCFRLLL